MAASMYIVVEGDDPGFDTFVNGRLVARHEDGLERMALALGVRPMIEYFSADENSMSLLVEEGAGSAELVKRMPAPQWYGGDEGLETVEGLIGALEKEPHGLGSEGPLVLEELREYRTVLGKTKERGLRWHLAVSWR